MQVGKTARVVGHLNKSDNDWDLLKDVFVEGVFIGVVSVVKVEFPSKPRRVAGGEGGFLVCDCVDFLGGPLQLGPRHSQPRVQ